MKLLLLLLVAIPAVAEVTRSAAAKDAFKRQKPCPVTHKPTGPCPGYVIDHVYPLACGGADAPKNMQWQTITEGKAKDRWELLLPGCPAKFSVWKRFKRQLQMGDK